MTPAPSQQIPIDAADSRTGNRAAHLPWLLALLLLSLLVTTIRPAYNWDLVPYVALAQDRGQSDAQWHAATWASLASVVPAGDLDRLRGVRVLNAGDRTEDIADFRQAVARDPVALRQQLPFYSVKPAFPLAIKVLGAVGVDPVTAAFAISRAGWVALGLALFALMHSSFRAWVALLLLGVFMSLPMVRDLGGFATPDAWCAALLVAAFCVMTARRPRYFTALALLVFAITLRPDSVLALLPVALVLAGSGRVSLVIAASAVGIGGLCFFLQSHLSGNYGWSLLMHYSFVDYQPYPVQAAGRVGPAELLPIYLSQLAATRQFFWFLALGGLLTLLARRTRWLWPLLALLAFMAAHWLVFPDQKDRMLVGAYLIVMAAAAQLSLGWLNRVPRLRLLLATGSEAR